MLRFLALCALCALGACADTNGAPVDIAPDAGSAGPTGAEDAGRTLEVSSDTSLQLGFGETVAIEARLREPDGRPVVDERVSFTLVGRSQDASLGNLYASTDAGGVAGNTLMAGARVATFRVRIAAAGAPEAFVDVAVSDAGFGTVVVDAPYTGERAVVQRILTAQAGADCENAERMPGDPTVVVSDAAAARFLGLPAETSYAVSAVAEGPDGIVLATGCVDGVVAKADEEVHVQLTFVDEPLVPAGSFELESDLDTTEPAASLALVMQQAANVLIDGAVASEPSPQAEASFWLDSLDRTLRAEPFASRSGFLEFADAIALERETPTLVPALEADLAAVLVAAERGPRSAAALLTSLSETSLARATLVVDVAIDHDGGTLPMLWHAQRLDVLPVREGVAAPSIDLGELSGSEDTSAIFLSGADALDIDGVRFGVAFGSLATQVARNVASVEMGHAEDLVDALGCDAFVAWIGAQTLGPRTCGEKCALATCERALARIVSVVEVDLLALDGARPWLTLHGELALVDEDGDLEVESMQSGLLWGIWHPASADTEGDFVSGTASAVSTDATADAP